jgi:hypothetical protein
MVKTDKDGKTGKNIERRVGYADYERLKQPDGSAQVTFVHPVLERNNVHGACSGRAIYINPSPSIGLPNCTLRNSYFNRSGSSEAGVDLNSIGGLTLQNLEFNNGSETSGRDLVLTSCTNVAVIACRTETYTFSTAGGSSAWLFSGSRATIMQAQFGTINYAAASFGFAITTASSSIVDVMGCRFALGTVGGGATTGILNGDYQIISDLNWATTPTYALYTTGTYKLYLDSFATTNKLSQLTLIGRLLTAQGAVIPSANSLTVGTDGNRFQISGTTQINLLDTSSWQGGATGHAAFPGQLDREAQPSRERHLQADHARCGSVDFSATANDQLTPRNTTRPTASGTRSRER